MVESVFQCKENCFSAKVVLTEIFEELFNELMSSEVIRYMDKYAYSPKEWPRSDFLSYEYFIKIPWNDLSSVIAPTCTRA